MTTKHKPTSEEKRIIRRCAQIDAGKRGVILEPGERYNIEAGNTQVTAINIALLSDDPDFGDTDLFGMMPWSEFTKGFELAPRGRAVVDFYVYGTGKNGELETNVTAYWEGGKLVRVEGTRVGDGDHRTIYPGRCFEGGDR